MAEIDLAPRFVGIDPLFPRDWYWTAEDGLIYGSARQGVFAADDPAYAAWRAGGRVATAWPRDDAGNQTDAALQAVLLPYGIWVDLLAYASDARWRQEVGGVVVAGVPVATDDRSKLMITGARVAAAADAAWTTVWHGADGQTYPIDAAAMLAISDGVQAHVNASFATFAAVKAGIEVGEITSTAEVDAAFTSG